MPPPGSGRAATAATMMVPVIPVVLPETQPRVDEGVRRVADVNDAVIDAGPYSRPGKRPRDDTAAPYDDACSGQAR